MLTRIGQAGQGVERIPSGRFDLRRIRRNLATRVIGKKRQHQRIRKRPRLTLEIARVGDLDADLFAYFARSTLLDRFAGLDETGQGAEDPGFEMQLRPSNSSFPRLTRTITAGEIRGYANSPQAGQCIENSFDFIVVGVLQRPQ